MVKVMTSIMLLLIISCGNSSSIKKSDDTSPVNLNQNLTTSCSVKRDSELGQVKITCPDGSSEIISDGQNGKDGDDGSSCTVEELLNGSMITCADKQAFIKNGTDGDNGSACTVISSEDNSGALIKCSDNTQAFIKNGTDGKDMIREVLDPCGAQSTSGHEEVLLILSDGSVMGHFDGGRNQFLSLLEKNVRYRTSDGTKCNFMINDDLELEYP